MNESSTEHVDAPGIDADPRAAHTTTTRRVVEGTAAAAKAAARAVAGEPAVPGTPAARKAAGKKVAAKKVVAKKVAAKTVVAKKVAGKKVVGPRKPAGRIAPPTYDVERELITRGAQVIAGVDEVGRGAWAGPVLVAAAITDLSVPPAGLTDSKLLTVRRREEVAAAVDPWVRAYAFGTADPEEIDTLGMTAALRLAAERALTALPVRPDAIVLDGKHDFLGAPWSVRCVIKGDQSCVSVAAASVLAKVHRDGMMAGIGEGYPAYGFAGNAGYPAPVHRAALAEYGPTPHHRMSWAYWDDLPAWRHLKRPRVEVVDDGQLGFDLG